MIHFPPFSAHGFRDLVGGALNGGKFLKISFQSLFDFLCLKSEFPPFSMYGFHRLVHGALNGGNLISEFFRLFSLKSKFPPFSTRPERTKRWKFHSFQSGFDFETLSLEFPPFSVFRSAV